MAGDGQIGQAQGMDVIGGHGLVDHNGIGRAERDHPEARRHIGDLHPLQIGIVLAQVIVGDIAGRRHDLQAAQPTEGQVMIGAFFDNDHGRKAQVGAREAHQGAAFGGFRGRAPDVHFPICRALHDLLPA